MINNLISRVGGSFLYVTAKVLGVRVTSWCRNAELNQSVGGSPTSKHLVCGAIDFGRETAKWKVDILKMLGKNVSYHDKGTAPHYHGEGSIKLVAIYGFIGAYVYTKYLKKAIRKMKR